MTLGAVQTYYTVHGPERAVSRVLLDEMEVQAEVSAHVLWAMTGPEVYDLFVRERGWEPERRRDWWLRALRRDLFP